VAVNATIADVNATSALGHAGTRGWIRIIPVLIRLGIEMPDLRVRNQDQARPGKGESPEDPKE
jgi:hypothetical protein